MAVFSSKTTTGTPLNAKQTNITNEDVFFILQPCLAACIDQTHKLLVTQASYPNEDSFSGTINFCLVLRKLVRSCNGDRRQVLDIKNPDLCPAIELEPKATQDLDCFNSNVTDQASS